MRMLVQLPTKKVNKYILLRFSQRTKKVKNKFMSTIQAQSLRKHSNLRSRIHKIKMHSQIIKLLVKLKINMQFHPILHLILQLRKVTFQTSTLKILLMLIKIFISILTIQFINMLLKRRSSNLFLKKKTVILTLKILQMNLHQIPHPY